MEFSLFHNGIKNIIPNGEIGIEDFLKIIKKNNPLLDEIRNCKDKDKRDELKSKLSYVTFAGTFEKRANNKIKESSGLACFDYDDIEDLEKVKKEIKKNKYTHFLFDSPSGKGLKLIVKIPEVKNNEEYRQYWISISEHFKGVKVDVGTKDISRACYVSFDENPYFNSDSEVYTKSAEHAEVAVIAQTTGKKQTSKDTTRSGKEYGEIKKLIRKGKTKTEVFKEMLAFSKWCETGDAYKETTYKNALKDVEETKERKEKKKEDDENTRHINKFVDEKTQIIIEQVYDKEKNKSQLCVFNFKSKEIKYVDVWEHNGLKYVCQEGEELEKGAVLLPSKAEEYNEEKLNEEIKIFVGVWLDVPKDVIRFGIWNIKRSWVYDKFNSLNYLRALGDTGLGKSRYLNTFGSIHYTPIFTTGATTPAPLFRILDKWGGTLVMDEADLKKSDESDDVIKIINQGFEKGNWIMRCDQNDASKISFFNPYCPKILATRKTFQDKATESRCITHVMEIKEVKNIPANLNDQFWKDAESLRNKLLMWRFKNYFKIDLNKTYDFKDLEPRIKQIVNSYVPLFSSNEKEMREFEDYITKYQEELIEDRQSSFDGVVIGAIHTLLKRGCREFNAKEIIEEGQIMGRTGKLLTPRGLSSSLKSLGFKKRTDVRIGKTIKKIIPLEPQHLQNLMKRYGFDVSVVSVVVDSYKNNKESDSDTIPRFLREKRDSVSVGGAIHKDRNNRNTETEKETETTETIKPEVVK